jgi:class 3 adenylate cyclase
MVPSRRQFITGLLGAGVAGAMVGCSRPSGSGAVSAPSSTSGAVASATSPIAGIECVPGASSASIGINYAWPDDHAGGQVLSWLGSWYDTTIVHDDLAVMADMGVRSVRAFCQLESVMSFDGRAFTLVPELVAHLHDFIDVAAVFDIAVLPVLADGHVNVAPRDLDGKFRWDLTRTSSGRAIYGRAVEDYVRELSRHENVVMWETANEPYGNLTWATVPADLGVTDDDAHEYLRVVYDAAKGVVGDGALVGFSDLEEDQQDKYRLVADPERRAALVDDCTDVYSLHIYRNLTSQIADLSQVTGKPLWCVELGAYNYDDPTGEDHGGQPADDDLYDEVVNGDVLKAMVPHLLEQGFELLMPWSFANNGGMVVHHPDGSHELTSSAHWLAAQMRGCP